jgi:phosphoenolpyruvate synthase/pyruvate phosphate dikinase
MIMKENGLVRGKKDLELYMMVEISSTALQAEEFKPNILMASIGSN